MQDGLCRACGEPITDSVYRMGGGKLYKSCPSCSDRAGEHVFYPCPTSFGFRKKTSGERFIQSYCTRCRSDPDSGPQAGGIPCGVAEQEGLYQIRSVRILPVIRSEFGGADNFDGFMADTLPSRGYRCFYKTGMKNAVGALALFQHEGRLAGYALIRDDVRVPGGIEMGSSQYSGYYELYPDTLTVFNEPIGPDGMRSIVPDFTKFSQSKKILDVSLLPMMLDRPSFREESTGAVLPEEIQGPVESLVEGAVKRISVNAYERNPKARKACIDHYAEDDGRIRCQICGFEFSEHYGEALKGMIHIHHLVEISSVKEQYEVDPVNDLIPVCPNCHAAIHSRSPPYSPDEIRQMMANRRDDRSISAHRIHLPGNA